MDKGFSSEKLKQLQMGGPFILGKLFYKTRPHLFIENKPTIMGERNMMNVVLLILSSIIFPSIEK